MACATPWTRRTADVGTEKTLLDVKNLNVHFQTPEGELQAVRDVSFSLRPGETLGVVGESGSGKSQTMLAMMGLLANNARAVGQVLFRGENILNVPTGQLNRVRGPKLAMIFQDPMTSLNPFLTVERQMTEVLQTHQNASRGQARTAAIKMLENLRIADPLRCLQSHPHQFSGGMRQRIMIAMALLSQPEVLIADEPTTALDVTVQAQIVALLRQLQQDHGTSIIMVTHDLGLVAGLSDQVMVMYGGRVMEHAQADDIFYQTRHPYTRALLESVPRIEQADDALMAIPGMPPSLRNMPAGCPFAPRCARADSDCLSPPPLSLVNDCSADHRVACHHAGAQS
jgi:oligopeptide transport system ATP-binding protein